MENSTAEKDVFWGKRTSSFNRQQERLVKTYIFYILQKPEQGTCVLTRDYKFMVDRLDKLGISFSFRMIDRNA